MRRGRTVTSQAKAHDFQSVIMLAERDPSLVNCSPMSDNGERWCALHQVGQAATRAQRCAAPRGRTTVHSNFSQQLFVDDVRAFGLSHHPRVTKLCFKHVGRAGWQCAHHQEVAQLESGHHQVDPRRRDRIGPSPRNYSSYIRRK